MSYTPPPGSSTVLNWTGAPYSVPPGGSVVLNFGAGGSNYILSVSLGDQSAFGSTTVTQPRSFAPVGIASTSVFGATAISNFDRTLSLSGFGIAAGSVGTPVVINQFYGVAPGGVAPPPDTGPQAARQVPTPFIDFRVRTLSPSGIAAGTVPTHYIAHEVQYIAPIGVVPGSFGTASITFSLRTIEVPFISSLEFGTAIVRRQIEIAPSSWESSTFSSDTDVVINTRRLYPTPTVGDPAGYGVPEIRNEFAQVFPTGWTSDTINFPTIYNLTQQVFVSMYMDSNDPQEVFGAAEVANVNREMRTFGHQSSRVGLSPTIYNAAVPITPAGIDSLTFGPDTFIAYENRDVAPQGWESSHIAGYSVVYNDARVIAAATIGDGSAVPIPQILNLNRRVTHVLPYGGESFGTAFVAPAVRYVAPAVFNDVPNGIPEVRFNPHPISPTGIVPGQSGLHIVEERFTIVAPHSFNVFSPDRVGEPLVLNRNRAVAVYPSDQSLYGTPLIYNYIQNITASAGDTSLFGNAVIADRTRTLRPTAISAPGITVLHRIRNDIPDAPGVQRIEPTAIAPGSVGIHVLSSRSIRPDGIYEGAFGSTTVTRNTIEVARGIFDLDQVGTPTVLATQYLFPKPIPWPRAVPEYIPFGESDAHEAKPQLSPYMIYAPSSDQATTQAQLNHPSTPELIDQYLADRGDGNVSAGGGWPWFGRPDVSNQYRTLAAHDSLDFSEFGVASVELGRKYVYPPSIRSLRFGPVVLLGVPQTITASSLVSTIVFGTPNVSPPDDGIDIASPTGIAPGLFGTAAVELFNRTIAPQGIPHRGNPEEGMTNPWGTPVVGYPRIYEIGGYKFTLWGTASVTHYTREVYPEGWESLSLIDESFDDFDQRMRITRRNPTTQVIGIQPPDMGIPTITFSVRNIYSRSIYDMHLGSPTITATATISPTGWDSFVAGDIDRWEENIIKPHGDDMSAVGTPRMLHTLRPSGIFEEIVESPRMAVPVYPLGIPVIPFEGPSFTDENGCGVRVIAPLSVLSEEYVSEPAISQ